MSASPGFDSRPMHDSISSYERCSFVFLLPFHRYSTSWPEWDQAEGRTGVGMGCGLFGIVD
jgi:hypothetical protein